MKFIFFFTSFFTLFTSVSFAQYSLSPRVGGVIDQSERQYFGLFPTVDGFVSAKASVKPDHQIEFVINRAMSGVNSDTAFSISSTVVENLVNYIEDFELVRGDKKSVNWTILEGLAASGHALENEIGDGLETIIETKVSGQFHGKLLYADDSSLVLWQSSEGFNWRNVQLLARVVLFSDVDNVTIEREGHFGSGLGWGALIGGIAGTPFVIVGANTHSGTAGPVAEGYYLIGLSLPVAGGLIGGTIGAIQGIDSYREVGGSFEEYLNILPLLKEDAVFSSYPPPELDLLDRTISDVQSNNVIFDTGITKQDQVNGTSNTLYLQTLGNSGSFSGNYERRLFDNFSARIGVGYDAGYHGGTVAVGEGVNLPILVYYIINFGRSNIQLGGGTTLRLNGQSAYVTASVGYRYQPKHGGFMFEIALTPNFTNPTYVNLGIGGGYTF